MSTPTLAPEEAYRRVVAGARLIDVRAPEEFADGHPERAESLPFTRFVEGRLVDDPRFVEEARARYAQGARLLVLCRSGARATRAAEALRREGGFVDVAVIEGGYEGTRGPFGEVLAPGWRRLGFP